MNDIKIRATGCDYWGRPYLEKGNTAKTHVYQDFLSFWKDGEPDEYNAATLGGKFDLVGRDSKHRESKRRTRARGEEQRQVISSRRLSPGNVFFPGRLCR